MSPISDPDSQNLILGVIATLLTLIAIIQSYRANKFASKAAIAQGTFKKPNVEIRVFGTSSIDDLIVALPLESKKVIEMPFTSTLLNRGEVSAREIEIFVRMNKDLRFGGHGKIMGTGAHGKKMKVAIANETENLQTIVTTVNSLHPNQHLVLADLISIISSTLGDSSVTAKTADNVEVTLKYSFEFAYHIDFIVSQADQPPITRRISLSIVDTSKRAIEDYFEEYNQKRAKEFRERRAKLSAFAWLKQVWAKSDPTKKIKVLIVERSNYKDNEILPGLRTLKVDSMKTCEGLKCEQGYFIPALRVGWPGLHPSLGVNAQPEYLSNCEVSAKDASHDVQD